MHSPGSSFSDRFGYHAPEPEITIREAAPPHVRDAILVAAQNACLSPSIMVNLLCDARLQRPQQYHSYDFTLEDELSTLMNDLPWNRVYDFAELFYAEIPNRNNNPTFQQKYETQINQFFRDNGVGWEMRRGVFQARISESFTLATSSATEAMKQHRAPTAAKEIHEALLDISRRPADVSGAIQHAMAALECVARQAVGSKDTLGKLISSLSVPPPLDQAIDKLWGFTSERGRHMVEGREPQFEEAELVVTIASAVSVYLLQRKDQRATLR